MTHTYIIRKYLVLIILLAATSLSCKKQQVYEGNPAVLQVFNALEDGTWLYANLTGTHPILYANALNLPNQRFGRVNINEAVQPLAFYGAKDTLPEDKPVWSTELELGKGKLYSLFLFGDSKAPGHLLMENHYPAKRTDDSVTHVRFANMHNAQPVSINLKGKPAGSLMGSLAYKEVSGFTALPVNKSVPSYEFEFRDAATGALMGTFLAPFVNDYINTNVYLNASWMLVVLPKPGGSGTNTLNIINVDNR